MNLNNSQIEWMLENSIDSEGNKRHSKILLFTIALSILLHFFLSLVILPLFIPVNTNSSYLLTENKTIQVRVIPTENKDNMSLLGNEQHPVDIESEKVVVDEPEKNQVIDNNNEIQKMVKKISNENIQIKDILDHIKDYDSGVSANGINMDSIVFKKDMRKTLQLIQDKKQLLRGIQEISKVNQENLYYEFSNIGGKQTIRINGDCFTIPQYEAFSLTQKNWILRGNCKKKKTWLLLKTGIDAKH